MNYIEQLESIEWKEKRNVILERDKSQCTKCRVKRSEFLGFDYEFGVLDYRSFSSKGYEIKRTGNFKGRLELTLNNVALKCNFHIEDFINVQFDKLRIAKQWKEQENPLMYKAQELVCFIGDDFDEDSFFDLNVHHKYYQIGKKAWEYPNDALITFCRKCHHYEHTVNKIPIIDVKGQIIDFAEKCNKCDGSGVLLEYKHYKNGICFVCNGRGDVGYV
nr:hypothetical protein [uncultured Flavobacterium sp.]